MMTRLKLKKLLTIITLLAMLTQMSSCGSIASSAETSETETIAEADSFSAEETVIAFPEDADELNAYEAAFGRTIYTKLENDFNCDGMNEGFSIYCGADDNGSLSDVCLWYISSSGKCVLVTRITEGYYSDLIDVGYRKYIVIEQAEKGVSKFSCLFTVDGNGNPIESAISRQIRGFGFNDEAQIFMSTENLNTEYSTNCFAYDVIGGDFVALTTFAQAGHAGADEGTSAPVENALISDAEALERYAETLDFYYYNLRSEWSNYVEPESYNVPDGEYVSYLFPYFYNYSAAMDEVGYTLQDLDGNGTPELLIGTANDNYVYDLYTCTVDGEIIHVLSGGERSQYQLCEDLTLYYSGSSGAAYTTYARYELREGSLFGLESVSSDETGWYYSSTYDSDTKEFVSLQYAAPIEGSIQGIMQKWPETVPFSITPFSAYAPQSMVYDSNEADTLISWSEFWALLQEASDYAWNWYWDPKYIDDTDSIPADGVTASFPYSAVMADDISSLEDLRSQSHRYFSHKMIDEMESNCHYLEQNGKLYISPSGGLGGDVPDQIYFDAYRLDAETYRLDLHESYCGGAFGNDRSVYYKLEDGEWVFDNILCYMGITLPIFEMANGSETIDYHGDHT